MYSFYMKRAKMLAVAACLLGFGVSAFGQDSLRLQAADLDSLYPGTCYGVAGCFPSLITYSDSAKTLGFVGDETHVAWYDVNFPSKPISIVVQYASPNASNIDFFLDSNQTGFYFWSCALPATNSTGQYEPIVYAAPCVIDYTQFPSDPTSAFVGAPHRLYLQFSCGVSGCGNYRSVTFHFGASKAIVLMGPESKRIAPRIQVVNSSTTHRSLLNSLVARGVMYDVRGRQVTSTNGKGIMIVKALQR
jgi:hypothetical protein